MAREDYPGQAPCPACFESSGYEWEHGNDWDSGPWSHQKADAEAFIAHHAWTRVVATKHMWPRIRPHEWAERFGLTCCLQCGNVKNDTSHLRSCKGVVNVGLRSTADRGGELEVKALEFYANPANWKDTPSWDGDPGCFTPKAIPIVDLHTGECDCGDTARKALALRSALATTPASGNGG